MPEFLINVKATGSKEATAEMDKLTESMEKLGISSELTTDNLKVFRKEMAELLKTADELNNKLDEIIKKKGLIQSTP